MFDLLSKKKEKRNKKRKPKENLDGVVLLQADNRPDQVVVVSPESSHGIVDQLAEVGLLVHYRWTDFCFCS